MKSTMSFLLFAHGSYASLLEIMCRKLCICVCILNDLYIQIYDDV